MCIIVSTSLHFTVQYCEIAISDGYVVLARLKKPSTLQQAEHHIFVGEIRKLMLRKARFKSKTEELCLVCFFVHPALGLQYVLHIFNISTPGMLTVLSFKRKMEHFEAINIAFIQRGHLEAPLRSPYIDLLHKLTMLKW